MALFEMIGKLGLNTAEFQTGMKQAESAASAAANKIKRFLAGAFTATAVVEFAKKISGAADEILNLAEAYDLTTDQIQMMQEAAARNGIQVEALTNATAKLTEARKKATEGDINAINAFTRMGISLDDVSSSSVKTFELLKRVGEWSSKSSKSFEGQAATMDLLGAGGVRLVGALRELESLGEINLVSEENLKKIDELGDKWEAMVLSIKRANMDLFGRLFTNAQLFFEALRSGDIAAENVRKNKGSERAQNEAYSQAFRNVYREAYDEMHKLGNFAPAPQPEDTGPLSYARIGTQQFGPLQKNQTWEELNAKKAPKKEKDEKMKLPSTGNLASIGGLYFGADYNMKLMTTMQKQLSALEKIDVNTKETNNILND